MQHMQQKEPISVLFKSAMLSEQNILTVHPNSENTVINTEVRTAAAATFTNKKKIEMGKQL